MAEATPESVVSVLIPLPVFYNPDAQGVRRAVDDEKFMTTADEIAKEWEAGGTIRVFRDGNPRGFWWDKGIVDRDVLALLEVDLVDSPEMRGWFKAYAKTVLLERFDQKAIYLKFVGPVETLVVTREDVTSE
jgi:hypothetical protein